MPNPLIRSGLVKGGHLSFRIHDHGGSLAVLGTGRATDLPKLPGRAILRTGADEQEIQTPLLEFGDAMKLLEEKFKDKMQPEDAKETPDPNQVTGVVNENVSKHDSVE